MRKLRILYIYSGKTSSPGWLTAHPLVCEQVEWIPHGVEADGSMARIKAAMLTPHSLQQVDLIISSEYYLSVGVNLRLLLTGCKTPHVVWGLNQSRKLLRPPGLRWLVNRVFNRADRVVTHSREESRLFQHLHQIPGVTTSLPLMPPRSWRMLAPTSAWSAATIVTWTPSPRPSRRPAYMV